MNRLFICQISLQFLHLNSFVWAEVIFHKYNTFQKHYWEVAACVQTITKLWLVTKPEFNFVCAQARKLQNESKLTFQWQIHENLEKFVACFKR